MDSINITDARSELEEVKDYSQGWADEIETKVDELTTIKDNLEEGVNQVEEYLEALNGLEDTLSNLESARDEASYHDISY